MRGLCLKRGKKEKGVPERISPCLLANVRGDEAFVGRLIRLRCLIERGWFPIKGGGLVKGGRHEATLWNESPRGEWDGLILHFDALASKLLASMDHRSLTCEWCFASTDFFPDILHDRICLPVTSRVRLHFPGQVHSLTRGDLSGSGVVELAMHPGWAFGTGNHPSTKGCLKALEWLSSQGLLTGRTVLDIGTGTGILSLVAVRFGAKTALGIDIDPEALAVARTNVERNGLEDRVIISDDRLGDLDHGFDLVLANLTPSVLVGLLPDIIRLAGNGGLFVLGGCRKKAMSDILKGLAKCAGIIWQDSVDTWETRIFKVLSHGGMD